MKTYFKDKKLKYEIFIVEQDDAKLFNRGMLLNIGYTYAKLHNCNYVVFHDIDMLPIDVDYSYSETPLHLATDFILEKGEKKREIFDEYFGGVTMFPIETFEKINGYSNKYWGWGYEDTDLLLRCKDNNVELDTIKLKSTGRLGKSLKFNGVDSYVRSKNVIDFFQSMTIFISFFPEDLELNHTKDSDEFTVFSIPGYDFAVCYNSFSRYNFCAFDLKLNALYINSNIKTNYKTNIVVTVDSINKVIKVYQDGIFIGETETYRKLYKYNLEPNFYLGIGNPNREIIPNYFKGTIDSFAYYNEMLSDDEIKEISNDNSDLRKYKSSKFLKTYYDANHIEEYKLIDLSGNDNVGEIINCEIIDDNFDEYTEVKIPYRRPSLFKSLKH
jgi:predicted glycosyltransferase involved in capsule biosynthesis